MGEGASLLLFYVLEQTVCIITCSASSLIKWDNNLSLLVFLRLYNSLLKPRNELLVTKKGGQNSRTDSLYFNHPYKTIKTRLSVTIFYTYLNFSLLIIIMLVCCFIFCRDIVCISCHFHKDKDHYVLSFLCHA